MLSSVGRAAIRRLVSTSSIAAPRRIAVSWPISHTVRYGRGFVKGFATAGRPKGSTTSKATTKTSKAKSTKSTKGTTKAKAKTTKGTTRKATASKAKSTKAKSKASASSKSKSKRPKRKAAPLTPEKKNAIQRKELKKTALYEEPKPLPDTPWTVYIYENTKDRSVSPDGLRDRMKSIAEAYKNLPASEHERLSNTVHQNKAKNDAAYIAWVESLTPEQTVAANKARHLLKRKFNYPATPNTVRVIRDPRIPKRPITPFSLFTRSRWATGDYAGRPFAEAAREISKEWLKLPDVERHAYDDLGKAARLEYEQKVEAVLHRKPGRRRVSAQPPAQ
ncbi:uncharacterized protein F4812DRAFT_460403 [Daldinia caldariorum]|uniref:uncharacterized protein n=1 Tax=Daldinia caldariorum TaxID=326644 RepID=UPI002008983E|nr:uncharacterized protein F4812DRAFT_460403 [Daldinia caldariorum]KAI1466845.1 hypothetical protein F4812DRAFT_460403 [Daldinia caldariorum]